MSGDVIHVYKPGGWTPLQTIFALRANHAAYKSAVIGYAGRLDPMAEGVLLLLVGNKNKDRKRFERLPKTYEWQLLSGISTDTYDALGIITSVKVNTLQDVSRSSLCTIVNGLLGTFSQYYPPYSAARYRGKPLYYWARHKREIPFHAMPKKQITVYSSHILKQSNIIGKTLAQDAVNRVSLIKGDFRQQEIIAGWRWFEQHHSTDMFVCTTLRSVVSSGAYIRSLAHTIGMQLGCGAIAYRIVRRAIGNYTDQDALRLG